MSDGRTVAIIGMGAVMPDAQDLQTFWDNILSGKDSIREVPSSRWRPVDHYDPDPKAPDKTYTKIGSFIMAFSFDSPKYRIPPRVAEAMDEVQKWTVEASRQALADAGYEKKEFDRERCAVVIGNALAGEMHYLTTLRVHLPRFANALKGTQAFRALPAEARASLLEQFRKAAEVGLPPITEDSMPGELSNVIAGRVAQAFGLRGPNFTTDAACASSLAALQTAAAGLAEGRYDMVLTGGVDSSMGPQSFVKFSKIGALSADMSCPFDERANGFVMGEGCGVLLLKRLADAERDHDRIYAVLRGIGSSSDGKGKGITAPNPVGQRLAVERAYAEAGVSPAEVGLIEAHGTSTAVGDVVEANTMAQIFTAAGARPRQIPMGSIKSQIGHLKSAAGAASLIKAALALHHKKIPGSLHFERPNPKIDFDQSPFFVPTRTIQWEVGPGRTRIAGVSAFGFGGTNFHAVLSEYVSEEKRDFGNGNGNGNGNGKESERVMHKVFAVGAESVEELREELDRQLEGKGKGQEPEGSRVAAERIAIAWRDDEELARRGKLALAVLDKDEPGAWRALGAQGVFRGRGKAGKVAFLFPGQGSQYVGMLRELYEHEPVVRATFDQADEIMRPILGRNLSDFVFTEDTPASRAALQDTTVCQPAMLTADTALARLLIERGIEPDMVAGHSLGEYAALVAAGMLPFEDALNAVCARAKEMAGVRVDDPGKMAAVFAPAGELMKALEQMEGVVPANFNSRNQTVIAGPTREMEEAVRRLEDAGVKAVELPVSHAFHSFIVAPARKPLQRVLSRLAFRSPRVPVVANLDAEPYDPDPAAVEANIERLAAQVASPVRWVESIERLYAMGARLFVEVGPKKVLTNFVLDVLDDPDVISVCTNHPKQGDQPSFSAALAACTAAGQPRPKAQAAPATEEHEVAVDQPAAEPSADDVVISGVSMGLPGEDHEVFADDNTERMLHGFAGIQPIPLSQREQLAGQRIVRLVKDAPGGPAFEVIDRPDHVARLTGRKGAFDLVEEFGMDPERADSFDVTTKLAIAAGLLSLRDAGIPLVMHYKDTSTGGRLPVGWRLPEQLADETGVIFASAFPGYDELVDEMNHRKQAELIEARLAELRALAEEVGPLHAVRERIRALTEELGEGFHLDRKFIFRALSMGHTQLAEQVGARGPNVQVNAACASTTLAVSLAWDWIRAGRCRRVLVVGADDITNPNLAPWLVGGLLATGAVTTEPDLDKAALPFDRRRNGMIPGMGAVGLVIEQAQAAAERGMKGLARLLGAEVANSAFHGTRLHPDHIAEVMQRLITRMEQTHGLDRNQMASRTVFISHETYTPARGGSAGAEVRALRHTFGSAAGRIVIANTKGYTGHPMGVGIEDAAAVRMLERQIVPPIANHRETDPELGPLNLSKGGHHDVRYALRLAAGFGSQIAMTLSERIDSGEDRVFDRRAHQDWLERVSGIRGAHLEVQKKTLRVIDDQASRQTAIEEHATVEAEPSPPSVDTDEIETKILAIVADKTGYPVDMLEPDLDMEADLGIDTVKQAEMFSEIRESFGIPKQEDLKLSDYPTLGHIIRFARDHTEAGPGDDPGPEDHAPAPTGTDGPVSSSKLRFLAPRLVGRPRADACLPTGIDLSGRSLIAGGDDPTAEALAAAVRAHGGSPVRLTGNNPEALAAEAERMAAEQPVRGIWILPGQARTVAPDEQDDSTWQEALDERARLPFRLAKALERHLAARQGTFFVCATRMGGHLGLDGQVAADPLAGLTTGFVKALAREWPDALCKVVDLPADADPGFAADALLDEVQFDPGVVEVGCLPNGRFGAGLEEVAGTAEQANTAWPPVEDPVVLVTGGTGGIASRVAADLAAHGGGTFYLVGRSGLPAEDDPEVKLLRADRDRLKSELVERLRRTNDRVTPVMVETALRDVERGASALDALEAVRRCGGRAHHAPVDITDKKAVAGLVAEIVARHGRLDAVIHAAGIDHSQALARKTTEAFDRIVGVKADGLRALLLACRDVPVRCMVLFGSIAGRFGNLAQTDYAAGNDMLAKSAAWIAQARPGIEVLTLAYGAWDGAGMATRGSVPRMMKQAGIGMIPLSEGAASVRRALGAGLRGEVVAAAELGSLVDHLDKNALDLDAIQRRLSENAESFALLDQVNGWTARDGLHLEVVFDAERDPYLRDHSIEGTPVVPGVMAVECFAEAVRLIHPEPGVLSIEDLTFDAPLKLYRDEPRRADLYLAPAWDPDGPAFDVRMETTRELAGGRRQKTCHYRARIKPGQSVDPVKAHLPSMDRTQAFIDKDTIYRAYFHGPSFQVMEQADATADGAMTGTLAAGRAQPCLGKPARMTSQPMLTELAFQTAGLMEARDRDRLGLPAGVDRLAIHDQQPGDPGRIAAWVVDSGNGEGRYNAKVVDSRGFVLVELDGYRTSALPGALPDEVRDGLDPARRRS